jgi:hypothetical protein
MDIKFVLILAVVIIVALLLHEFSSFKKNINIKLNDIENKFNSYNVEFSNIVKRETLNSNNKFKIYTSDMVQQIRKMNKIENQQVTLISDGFDDDITIGSNNKYIPYLSDSNQICFNSKEKTKKTTDNESLYMSETENEQQIFIIKDNNNILNSTQLKTHQFSDSKLSDIDSRVSSNKPDIKLHNIIQHNNQSDNQPNNQSDNQSNNKSDNQSNNQSNNQSDKQKNILIQDNNTLDENINNLKLLQQEMESVNDESSQDITFGSSKDKTNTNECMSQDNIVDELSIGTTDDNTFKLYSIGKYTKTDLIHLAKRHNIKIPSKINKDSLYMVLKKHLN